MWPRSGASHVPTSASISSLSVTWSKTDKMPTYYHSIPPHLRGWILSQPLFFTASAPLSGSHINVSPKGLASSTLTILDPNRVAYLGAPGGGCAPISHAYENGRVTIMFCSFGPGPRIVRLFCAKARVVEWDRPEFGRLCETMGGGEDGACRGGDGVDHEGMDAVTADVATASSTMQGARAIIVLDVFKVQISCGYGVPLLQVTGREQEGETRREEGRGTDDLPGFADRDTLSSWANKMTLKNELRAYQMKNNARSLDGLTGLRTARRDCGQCLWLEDCKVRVGRMLSQWDAILVGLLLGIGFVYVLRLFGRGLGSEIEQ